jgi:radical SAM protein with 4Fe4S-binding SPASM domain
MILGSAMNLPHELFLTQEQIQRALKDTIGMLEIFRARGLKISLQPTWGPLLTHFERMLFSKFATWSKRRYCPGGSTSFGVDPITRGVWTCNFAMAVDPLRIGHFDDNDGIVLTEDWPYRLNEVGDPCRSCRLFDACGGGCRGTAIAEHFVSTGQIDLLSGFQNCPVALGIELPRAVRSVMESIRMFRRQRGGMSPHPDA